MITNADITIYNKQTDPDTRNILYIRHFIQNVSWYEDCKVSAVSGGLSGGNIFKIRIPEEALADKVPALICYMPSEEYFAKETGERSGYWTVQNGDYFCKGQGGEIEKPSDLAKQHVPYGQIRSIGDNRRGGIPHIRIEGW